MVYAVGLSTVTRAQSKVQKRENSIEGVYSVHKIGRGGVICNVKYEKNTEGQKILKKGAMIK